MFRDENTTIAVATAATNRDFLLPEHFFLCVVQHMSLLRERTVVSGVLRMKMELEMLCSQVAPSHQNPREKSSFHSEKKLIGLSGWLGFSCAWALLLHTAGWWGQRRKLDAPERNSYIYLSENNI
jgi:hypothetical protein